MGYMGCIYGINPVRVATKQGAMEVTVPKSMTASIGDYVIMRLVRQDELEEVMKSSGVV